VRRKLKKRPQQPPDLDVTPFLNLMVVLIPFLLATAVFSQVAIQELNLPQSSAGGATPDKPVITIEVMLRQDRLEIGDGKVVTTSIPNVDGKHDLERLSLELRNLKIRYPEKEDINVLIEPKIRYNDVIGVMDAVKLWVPPQRGEASNGQDDELEMTQELVLFPEISIGDAP
jgi:biopolymer transport protein ExbD